MFPVERASRDPVGGNSKAVLGFQRTATGAIFDGLGEMKFDWKGRKEVYILRRREMVKTRFPSSGALMDSRNSTGCAALVCFG